MCSIIGVTLTKPSSEDLSLVRSVFRESSIRGLHATGLSFVKNNKIVTIKEPVPALKFDALNSLQDYVNEDGNLYLIGHCRYSTSDLEFNQPIFSDNLSVVHNGVITQELPENWKKLYGYDVKTRNDTELLVHTIEAGREPLLDWKDSSMAVVELHLDKTIRYYRNGKRPIYHTKLDNGVIITSTKDIMTRSSRGAIAADLVAKDCRIVLNAKASTDYNHIDTNTVELQYA